MSRTTQLLLSRGRPSLLQQVGTSAGVRPGGANQAHGRRRTINLPVLLAGPILRRCTRREVMVWVAMSSNCRVRGEVRRSGGGVLGRGQATAFYCGQHLWLCWLTIVCSSGSYPARTLLEYDLTFAAPPGHAFDHGRGLVPRAGLTYGNLQRPSFILDAGNVHYTHLMHASCRKLHGRGADASARMDVHLRDRHNNLTTRPRMLLLTGDQIYADDVSGDMIRAISTAGNKLLGFPESLPLREDVETWVSRPLTSAPPQAGQMLLNLRNRRPLIINAAGFKTDPSVGENHVLGFGEFAALYLLSWSPALWNDVDVGRHLRQAYARNHDDTVKLRRVMANVPCYMQLDDHEVTDDWVLDTTMQNDIERLPYGKWIVANALAACWLFQLQGNGIGVMPAIAQLGSYLSHTYIAMTTQSDHPNAYQLRQRHGVAARTFLRSYVNAAYGIRNAQLGSVTPTVPPVILLDTRTQRALTARGAPGLLDRAGRQWLRSQLRRWRNLPAGMPVLLVSPAPVIGNPQFEAAAARLVSDEGGIPARYIGDREHWMMNNASLRPFLRVLAGAGRRVVIFSGDVHFGYTAQGRLEDGSTRMDIVQLNSSALRNRTTNSNVFGLHRSAPWQSWQPHELQDGARLQFMFFDINGVSAPVAGINRPTSLFTYNNFGGVKVEWTSRDLEVLHKLIGEGHEGIVTVNIRAPRGS